MYLEDENRTVRSCWIMNAEQRSMSIIIFTDTSVWAAFFATFIHVTHLTAASWGPLREYYIFGMKISHNYSKTLAPSKYTRPLNWKYKYHHFVRVRRSTGGKNYRNRHITVFAASKMSQRLTKQSYLQSFLGHFQYFYFKFSMWIHKCILRTTMWPNIQFWSPQKYVGRKMLHSSGWILKFVRQIFGGLYSKIFARQRVPNSLQWELQHRETIKFSLDIDNDSSTIILKIWGKNIEKCTR